MLKFAHDVAGGQGNLIATALKSPDYSPGVSGWAVFKDGSAEFNNATIRGTIVASVFKGTDFEIDQQGAFFYDPVTLDIVASSAPADGTNVFGDPFLQGQSAYYVSPGGVRFALNMSASGGYVPLTWLVDSGSGFTAVASIASIGATGLDIDSSASGDLTLSAGAHTIILDSAVSAGAVSAETVTITAGPAPAAPASGSTLYSDTSGIARVINQDGQAFALGSRLVQNTAGSTVNSGGAYGQVISSGTLGTGTYRVQGQISYSSSVGSPTGSPRVRFDAGTATQGHSRGSFINGNSAPVVIDKGLTSSDTFAGNALTSSEQLMAFDFVVPVTAAGTFTVICASTGSTYTVNFVNLTVTPA